jgi:hypothetical protein
MSTREELVKAVEDAWNDWKVYEDAAEAVYLNTIAALNAYDKENT